MYLSEVLAENFRVFGSGEKSLQLSLQPGLNALVGENDGGKSAIVDAIRLCLLTTSQDYQRYCVDDFHCNSDGRTNSLRIRCRFSDLDIADQACFMEWLTTDENGLPVLYVQTTATLLDGKQLGRIAVVTHSGENGNGPTVEGMMRELLKTTYLRPLRDAEAELSPGRNSRLSQILVSHPQIALEANNDFSPEVADSGTTLVGIMKRAEHAVAGNQAVLAANNTINDNYLGRFQIGSDSLTSEVGVAGDTTLSRILEKLELVIAKPESSTERTRRGLGYNNALFMSAELLLLGSREAYPTLLIEEPEAHLHPQLQACVIDLLNEKTSPQTAKEDNQEGEPDAEPGEINVGEDGEADVPIDDPTDVDRPVQVLMTTHSPNLASTIPLSRITLVSCGRAYSLAPAVTKLSKSDYAFLERFLDATKANLFFARGVAIVEGDAENILLPALAELTGFSFRKNGLSIVNVGHTGLFRYSNIFRRQDDTILPIRVACIRDRDIVPNCAPDELKGKLKRQSDLNAQQHQARIDKFRASDGGSVKTFVSDHWTFEYDLAAASWKMAKVIHRAVSCASEAESKWPNDARIKEICEDVDQSVDSSEAEGKSLEEAAVLIYTPLRKNDVSKTMSAQFASKFLDELKVGIGDLPSYLREAFTYVTGSGDEPAV